jgi:hypothetical protein
MKLFVHYFLTYQGKQVMSFPSAILMLRIWECSRMGSTIESAQPEAA